MEIHRYYVTRRKSIYYLVAALVSILVYIYIKDIGSWIILKNFDVGGMIIRYSPCFRTLGIISFVLFFSLFFRSLEYRSRPGFLLCSHFLIIDSVFGTEILSWEEIRSIQVVGNYLRIGLDSDSKKIRRKRSIKHVKNKKDLIKEIKEYCGKYEIEFSQDLSK